MARPARLAALAARARPAGRAALAAALALALAVGADGEEAAYAVGDRVEPFALEDPHGRAGGVDARTRLLLFTADMDAGDVVEKALADPALHDLAAHGTVYVADISRMPGVVTRLFALPSLRRRPYRTLLDTGPGPTTRIPREAGKVTLLELDGLAVRSVRFESDPAAVAAAIRGPASEAPAPQPEPVVNDRDRPLR